MASPSDVHRTTITTEQIKYLLSSGILDSPLMGDFKKRCIKFVALSEAGLGGIYTKSNAPKSDADKLLDAFGTSSTPSISNIKSEPTQEDFEKANKEMEEFVKSLESSQPSE